MNMLIVFTAQYVFLLSILIYLVFAGKMWLKEKSKFASFLVLSIISFPLSLITAKILSHFIYNPRPFVVEHIKPLIAHAADNGFPSDHTLLTAAIASVIFAYNKKLGIVLFIISLLTGGARVLAQIHHTSDIIGGFVISIAATYISWLITKHSKLPFVKTKG